MYYRQQMLLGGTPSGPNEWGAAHSAIAYPIGAVAQSQGAIAAGATSVFVYGNHEFRVGDKALLWRAGQTVYLAGAGVTAVDLVLQTITFDGAHQIVAGDRLICLGPDSGNTTPQWNGSRQQIFQDPEGALPYSNARTMTDQFGNYGYYTLQPSWELVLDPNNQPVHLFEGNGLEQTATSLTLLLSADQLAVMAGQNVLFDTLSPTDNIFFDVTAGVIRILKAGRYRLSGAVAVAGGAGDDFATVQWWDITRNVAAGTVSVCHFPTSSALGNNQSTVTGIIDANRNDQISLRVADALNDPKILAASTWGTIQRW